MIFGRLKSIRRNSGKKQAAMERMDSLASSGTPTESTRGGTAEQFSCCFVAPGICWQPRSSMKAADVCLTAKESDSSTHWAMATPTRDLTGLMCAFNLRNCFLQAAGPCCPMPPTSSKTSGLSFGGPPPLCEATLAAATSSPTRTRPAAWCRSARMPRVLSSASSTGTATAGRSRQHTPHSG